MKGYNGHRAKEGKMVYDIKELSQKENDLINKGAKYGDVFHHANRAINLMGSFVKKIDKTEGYMFGIFVAQVRKCTALAFLSILRQHDVQCQMMLRQALEAGALACYALYKRKSKDFAREDPDGTLIPRSGVLDKAYKWILGKYPKHSKSARNMKKAINDASLP